MNDTGTCRDCALKENCAEYKENKSQCEDYESYNEVMTNEEWLEQASTEEKARFLDKICYSAWGDKNSRFKDMADYTDWMEWLKEIRHE